MKINRHLRFGTHAETKYFLNGFSDLYDEIVFNGNMVAYTQAAIAAFIINVSEKKFIIDPQTHAFQHDPAYLMSKNSKGEMQIKKSIMQLAEKLGGPALDALNEKRAVTPSDFDDASHIDTFAKGTINFQKSIIEEIKKQDDWEYLKYKLQDSGGEEPHPNGLVAPYFFMSENSLANWLSVNIKLIDAAQQYVGDNKLLAELVISRDILVDIGLLRQVIDSYKAISAETILLWIDGLNEVEASRIELKHLRQLCQELSDSGKVVTNLHGGYFSVLLASKGYLAGVCNGLEYGENRAVVPVGGGIPMSKYYFSPLHFRMRYADLLTIYNRLNWKENTKDFAESVCDCDLCKDGDIEKYGETNPVRIRRKTSIITLNYPTQEAKDFSLKHYLHAKSKEFQRAGSDDFEALKAQLLAAKQKYEKVIGFELVAHIDKWISALED